MMSDNNRISLFSNSRNIEVQPINMKRLKVFMDPVHKTLAEYQQFKKNINITSQAKQRKLLSKSFEKNAQSRQLKKISQSMDNQKIKTNQSQISMINPDTNQISRKGLVYESSTTSVYKITIDGHFNYYALKISRVNPNKCTKEAYFLKQLRHPNIIELKHYYVVTDKTQNNTPYLHEILPLMSCNLRQFILQFAKLSQNTTYTSDLNHKLRVNLPVNWQFGVQKQKAPQILFKLFIYQLVRAVAYLHSKRITHRDLNPRNILLDLDTLCVQLCDFNSARILSTDINNINYVGERNYRAPELLLGSKNYGNAVDLWSLGCIIAECFLGTPLFGGSNTVETMAEIIKLLGTPKAEEMKQLKSPILDLKMPDIPKFCMEKRFKDVKSDHLVDLLERLLIYDPYKRMSAFDILLHPFFQEIKQPNIKINSKSLPNIFNFTKDELESQDQAINQIKLIPDWYIEKQKRFEYLKTSMEDAKLILDR